jgi:hypothetical protein
MKKIKIIEGMDLYQEDILNVFETSYLGKVINDYDHKQLLVGGINTYIKEITGDVLSTDFDNVVFLSYDLQKQYLSEQGRNTDDMSEQEIMEANTGTYVFLESNVLFVDAMEDFKMITRM